MTDLHKVIVKGAGDNTSHVLIDDVDISHYVRSIQINIGVDHVPTVLVEFVAGSVEIPDGIMAAVSGVQYG